jgi:hypothetical protein
MKRILLSSTLSLLVAACGGDTAKDASKESANEVAKNNVEIFDKKAAAEEAKGITKAFAVALKAELQSAMKAGGPINALQVCNTKAMGITAQVAKEKNAQLSRVSLKNRNPINVPNEWQKTVLEDFDARAAKGEDVQKMGFAEVVEKDGKKQLRFMKALPTGDLCLACHGSNLSPDLQAKLAELYPEDKATGYEKGQVRGAIVVLKDYN